MGLLNKFRKKSRCFNRVPWSFPKAACPQRKYKCILGQKMCATQLLHPTSLRDSWCETLCVALPWTPVLRCIPGGASRGTFAVEKFCGAEKDSWRKADSQPGCFTIHVNHQWISITHDFEPSSINPSIYHNSLNMIKTSPWTIPNQRFLAKCVSKVTGRDMGSFPTKVDGAQHGNP